MTTRMKIKIALMVIALAWGFYEGGWAGGMAVFMFLGFLGFAFQAREEQQQPMQVVITNEEALRGSEFVPAKRGKPDPTRPDANDDEIAGFITANYERLRKEFK